jgi:hypothetical protein
MSVAPARRDAQEYSMPAGLRETAPPLPKCASCCSREPTIAVLSSFSPLRQASAEQGSRNPLSQYPAFMLPKEVRRQLRKSQCGGVGPAEAFNLPLQFLSIQGCLRSMEAKKLHELIVGIEIPTLAINSKRIQFMRERRPVVEARDCAAGNQNLLLVRSKSDAPYRRDEWGTPRYMQEKQNPGKANQEYPAVAAPMAKAPLSGRLRICRLRSCCLAPSRSPVSVRPLFPRKGDA